MCGHLHQTQVHWTEGIEVSLTVHNQIGLFYCAVSGIVTVEHQSEEGSPRVVDITLIKNQKGTSLLYTVYTQNYMKNFFPNYMCNRFFVINWG